jgi:hypothetical protein
LAVKFQIAPRTAEFHREISPFAPNGEISA